MTTNKKTQFPNIKRELEKENKKNLKYQLGKINKTEEQIKKEYEADRFNHKDLNEVLEWTERNILDKRSSYSGTLEKRKEKIKKSLIKKYEKSLKSELDYLKKIEKAEPLNNLTITVEWKKSYMWGKNPNASDNFGNVSGSIGGCGYDKLSTATANILNQHLYLIKLMCQKEEHRLKELKKANVLNWSEEAKNKITRRAVIGYGSGYGIIPSFEGGVGIECHKTILARFGYEMKNISSTKNTDIFIL